MRISDWSSDVCSSDLHAFARDEAVDLLVPQDLDLGIGEEAVLQDLFGAQMVAAVDQRHIVAMVGQVQRLLDRGVAATDHHDLLAAIEEAVAGRAGRDALAAQFLLARNAEPFGLRTCRADEHTSELQSIMRTSYAVFC